MGKKKRKQEIVQAVARMRAPAIEYLKRNNVTFVNQPTNVDLVKELRKLHPELSGVAAKNEVILKAAEKFSGEVFECIKAKKKARKTAAKSKAEFDAFYLSKPWRQLRFKAFLKYGRSCLCCNATDKPLHVDHVKPRSKFPELELELSNLQILCEDCNMGKGGWSAADFREPEKAEEPPADFVGFDAAFRDTIGKLN